MFIVPATTLNPCSPEFVLILKSEIFIHKNANETPKMWAKYSEMFSSPHSAGANGSDGHEWMLSGSLESLLMYSYCHDFSISSNWFLPCMQRK